MLQAEALAAATVGAPAAGEAGPGGDDAVAAEVARLSIRQRADLILRKTGEHEVAEVSLRRL